MCRKKRECTACVACSVPVTQTEGKGRARLYCDDCRKSIHREPPAVSTLRSCLECGKQWMQPACVGRKPKVCSRNCRERWRYRQRATEVRCARCGSCFVSASGRAKFCKSCDRLRKLSGHATVCVACGSAFYNCPSSTKKHCSRKCLIASIKKSFVCTHCNKTFSRRKYRKGDTRKYCSIQCYWDANGMTGRTTAKLKGHWLGNTRKRCRKAGVAYDPSVTIARVAERDAFQCQICKRQCNRQWLVSKRDKKPHPLNRTVDHIVPLAAGVYGHEWHNVQCACLSCNLKKGAKRRHGQLRLL